MPLCAALGEASGRRETLLAWTWPRSAATLWLLLRAVGAASFAGLAWAAAPLALGLPPRAPLLPVVLASLQLGALATLLGACLAGQRGRALLLSVVLVLLPALLPSAAAVLVDWRRALHHTEPAAILATAALCLLAIALGTVQRAPRAEHP